MGFVSGSPQDIFFLCAYEEKRTLFGFGRAEIIKVFTCEISSFSSVYHFNFPAVEFLKFFGHLRVEFLEQFLTNMRAVLSRGR